MTAELETKNLVRELKDIFGPDDSGMIPASYVQQLLKLSWQEKLDNVGLRPLYWRVLLGLLSNKDKTIWSQQLKEMSTSYQALKTQLMPSFDKVDIDPLSALAMGDSNPSNASNGWGDFYKQMELTDFIKGDLDRLYLTGIEDDYFQTPKRRDMVLAILFVWAQQHSIVSYRQGMHEIVGCVLYLVEGEAEYWEQARVHGDIPDSHPLYRSFAQQSVEAHTYAIFDRIMLELECLYDPLPVAGADSQPFIVHFCAKIQEHYLRILDPMLSQHLEECFVQSQLYGLRWSRLLLGREFSATHSHLFRLWDFMFASCYEAENNTNAHQYEDEDSLPNVYSMFAYTRMNKLLKDCNVGKRKHKDDKVTYVCTPLLGALGDFMLAMLIQIRTELLESDLNSVIMYVMRYPQRDSVTQLIECADMIRRGVIVRDINEDGAILNYGQNVFYRDDQLARPTIVDFGKKVTDKLNVIKSAVGTGWNDIVQHMAAPLRDSNVEEDPNKEHMQHIYRENSALDTSSDKIEYHSNSIYKTNIAATPGTLQRANSQTNQTENPLMDETSTVATEDESVARSSTHTDVAKEEPPKVEVKAVDPNIDPLSGLLTATTRSVPPASVKRPSALNKPGEGTGYANMPDSLMSPSLENNKPFAANTPTASKSSGMSLFSPNWFPSSSTKSTKKKDQNNRLSAGVNLQDLQQYAETSGEYAKGSSNETAKNNAVGDRLLEIADHLAALSGFDNGSGDDEDVCIATAKRLRGLADILGGYTSIVDFDMKFANKELPKTFPHVTKLKRGSNASISSLHSDASQGGSQATPEIHSDAVQMMTLEESPKALLYLDEEVINNKAEELSPTNVNEAPVSIDSPN